jgi:hypothetical protein
MAITEENLTCESPKTERISRILSFMAGIVGFAMLYSLARIF